MIRKPFHFVLCLIVAGSLSLAVGEPVPAEAATGVSEKAIKKATENLKSKKIMRVRRAAKRFEEWGRSAAAAVPQILQSLDTISDDTIWYSYTSLVAIAPQDERVQVAIVKWAEETPEGTATKAARVLAEINPTNQRIIGTLIDLAVLDQGMGGEASNALQKLSETNPEVIIAIIEAFERNPGAAFLSVMKIGESARAIEPKILNWIGQQRLQVQELTTTGYFLDDESSASLFAAIFALKRIRPSNPNPHEQVVQLSGEFVGLDIAESFADETIAENYKAFLSTTLFYLVDHYSVSTESKRIVDSYLQQMSKIDPGEAFNFLYSVSKSNSWNQNLHLILGNILDADTGFLSKEILLFKLANGRLASFSKTVHDLLEAGDIHFVEELTPEQLFAKVESDTAVVKERFLAQLDSEVWHKRVGAIVGLTSAGLRNEEIIRAIIDQWDQNHEPGNVAVIQALGKLGKNNRDAISFLTKQHKSKKYPRLDGEFLRALEQ